MAYVYFWYIKPFSQKTQLSIINAQIIFLKRLHALPILVYM